MLADIQRMLQDFPMQEPEHIYLAGLSIIWLALVAVVKVLWQRSQDCEKWRNEKEPLIVQMAQELGIARGTVDLVDACHVRGCPFAGKMPETFSSQDPNKKNKP